MDLNPLHLTIGGLGTLLSIGVGIGTLYQIFIRPVLIKHQKEVEKTLADTGSTAAWRTRTEGRLDSLEQSDSRIYNGVENVRLGLEQLRQESMDAHTQANEHVHTEVRRLEDKMSEGRSELFRRIDGIRDAMMKTNKFGG